jgi:hypothetical protein
LSQKIDTLSQKHNQLRPEDVVNDWTSLSRLLDDNPRAFSDLVVQSPSVTSKFNDIDSAISDIKSKVGS